MKVFLSTKADQQLRKLPTPFYKILISRIENLIQEPFPSQSQKLAGRPGWRIRVGDYRILYAVKLKAKEITILSVAYRREAYKKM